MNNSQQNPLIIPFLPYTIAQSGTYVLAHSIEYNDTVRGDFLDSAIKIGNGANVVLNLNNTIFDAHEKKYAIDATDAGSIFVFGGSIKNADVIVKCFCNNVRLIDTLVSKYTTVMDDTISLHEAALYQSNLQLYVPCKPVRSSKKQGSAAVIIGLLPYTITRSGSYYLSSNVGEKSAVKKTHFDSAIRIYNNANVVLNLNGNTLDAANRTFGVDANGSQSLFLCNGTIKNAVRALSSLKNDVWLENVIIERCKYSSIEVTPEKTHITNVNYINCADQ
jgi:hypothetical protein